VVDITTTGATLAANGLKLLSDGLILKSQAHLASGLRASWAPGNLETCRRLLTIFEARARAKTVVALSWPTTQDARARAVLAEPFGAGIAARPHGVLLERSRLFAACGALAEAGVGPVSVEQPGYVFEPACLAADRLADAVGGERSAG